MPTQHRHLLAGLAFLCSIVPFTASAATLNVQVNSSDDDVEERPNGSIARKSSDLEMVDDNSGKQVVGLRFTDIQIPQGTQILSAFIQFGVDETTSDPTTLTIEGHAADNAEPFTSSGFNVSSRARTSAVQWSPPAWTSIGANGPAQRSTDLSGIVQALVNRNGWSAGNAMAFIVTGSGERVAEAYDGNASLAAVLHIDYVGAPVNQAPVVDAGTDITVTLPAISTTLNGAVSDDGLPDNTLLTNWTHVGGTGSGVVTFTDSSALSTVVTFSPEPGTYTLRLTADDGALTALDEVVVTLDPEGLTTVNRQISAPADDAEERVSGNVSITSSDLEMVQDGGGPQQVGMRFTDITIPQGANILTAHLQFTADERTSVLTQLTINGEYVDNAAAFTSAAFNISSRTKTSTSVAWLPPPWLSIGEAAQPQRSPEVAAIIQEIVDRAGWSPGNALAFIVSGSGERVAESFNGVSSAAPRLYIEYGPPAGNQPPVVFAGPDRVLVLPDTAITLNGSVTDDGLPGGPLQTSWQHIGGTGGGTVSFEDPNDATTTATFSPDPGTYVLQLSSDDGELSSSDTLTVNVSDGTPILSISQTNHFHTGFDGGGNPLIIPSIDPAGVYYDPNSDALFIADSEINEVPEAFGLVGANLFQTSTDGSAQFNQWDTTVNTGNEPVRNREPTGICAIGNAFYITNDDNDLIYRYLYDGTSFTAVDSVSTRPTSDDPEGIGCDAANNTLYVIGGAQRNVLEYSYSDGFVLQNVLDLPTTAGDPQGIPADPEGITFDPVSGHLFVLSDPDDAVFEYRSDGTFVQRFDLSQLSPSPVSLQGVSIGTASDDSTQMSFYLVDGGFDNDFDPDERDGAVYEMRISRSP